MQGKRRKAEMKAEEAGEQQEASPMATPALLHWRRPVRSRSASMTRAAVAAIARDASLGLGTAAQEGDERAQRWGDEQQQRGQ
jgi:hypothetical protein